MHEDRSGKCIPVTVCDSFIFLICNIKMRIVIIFYLVILSSLFSRKNIDSDTITPPLDIDGSLVIVGQIGLMEETLTIPLVMGRRRAAGSLNEGIAKTLEVLDFCATHNVYPECGMINIEQINDALARPEQGIGHTVSLLIWHRSAQNKCIS